METSKHMMLTGLLLAAFTSSVLTGEWKASVVSSLDALVSSCVVIPCSFTHPEGNLPTSRLRGIWHISDQKDQLVFHEDGSNVLDKFKGRTKLLGHLGQSNCTLEIINIKDHDNGPFCFRVELIDKPVEKFSFVEDCANLKMLPDPPKPKMTHLKSAVQGLPFTLTCTVAHTCPSRAPQLTWNKGTADGITELHREIHAGNWELQSILTFIPEEKDDHSDVTCTATFNGAKTSSEKLTLYVKRTENYNHIIIPTVVGIGTALIFVLFSVLMVKKYKARIAELQNQDGSVWNRLSRLSRRIRSDGPGPSRSEQRRSMWSRFSRRRPQVDMMNQMPSDVNSKSSCSNQKISKPRFPSPKSQQKSYNNNPGFDGGDDYMNSDDLNVYGNV